MEVTWGHISLRYFLPRSVNCVDTTVRRGDIYYADLSPVVGSEQGGVRPVLIVQNDTGNRHSPTVIAAAITSQLGKAKLPTHIALAAQGSGGDGAGLVQALHLADDFRRVNTVKHDTAVFGDTAQHVMILFHLLFPLVCIA